MAATKLHDHNENAGLYITEKKLHFLGSNNLYFDRRLRYFGINCYFHL